VADAGAHDAVRLVAGNVAAAVPDLALFRVHHAGDGLQERRLARAIGAQHGDDLPLAHLQRHAADRHDRAVEALKVLDRQNDIGGAACLGLFDFLLEHQATTCWLSSETPI
jgi:hypothetical protein